MIRPKPFFILGYERSGTTLLASLLDRHPDIAVPPETHFVNETARRFHFTGAALPVESLIAALKQNNRISDLNVDWLAFQDELPEAELPPAVVLDRLLHHYAAARCKKNVGEKTPGHMYCVEQVVQWFPESKIIWLVRDGRDVVLSLKRVPWIHSSVRRHSVKWVARTTKMREVAARNVNVLSVKYEDILENPVAELKRIHDHIGIPFVPSQLEPSASSDVAPDWEAEWKGKVYEGIDPSRAFSWKREASSRDLQVMQSAMGPMLGRLGYPEGPPPQDSWNDLANGSLNLIYRGLFASRLTNFLRPAANAWEQLKSRVPSVPRA